MSLQRLIELVPPPANPVDAGTPEQWDAVESELGIALPQDYKALINTYGVGWFANWICVFSPFSARSPLVQPDYWELIGDKGNSPEFHHPFTMFPSPGGLLPWGEDDNRHPFCWQTQGSAEAWPTINLDGHYSENFIELPATVTGILAGWFAGELTGDWYPEDIEPVQARVFTSGYTPRY